MDNLTITAELKSHFLRLYQLAMVDGDFSPLEWKMLYQFAEERNIEKEELDKILLNPIGEIKVPEKVETRIEYLYDFAKLIWADGKVTADEENTLKKFCKKFEFLDENIDELTKYLLDNAKNDKSLDEILNELNN